MTANDLKQGMLISYAWSTEITDYGIIIQKNLYHIDASVYWVNEGKETIYGRTQIDRYLNDHIWEIIYDGT